MQKSFLRRWQVALGMLIVLGLVISTFQFAQARPAQLSDPPSNQVAVKLKPGVTINTILARYKASLLGTITETNFYFLQLASGQTADQILPTLNADADLYYAEPNYYVEGTPGGTYIMFYPRGNLTPTPSSSDSDLWAWLKIGLADAQKISDGHGIIVAVLDTGLAADHPLLQSSIQTGYDFVGMDGNIYDTHNGLDDNGNGLVDEGFGHGTHVAGIIVTVAPGVQVMPIRVLNSDGVGTYQDVAAGIRFAVDHGAKVINMSMSAPRLTPSLADALGYAASHRVIVVAAAGTGSGPNYPAGYSDRLAVIGVGATDRNDNIASFSGGLASDTDVFAPGVDIYSSYPYNGYALGSGTSMAAPIVAAEAAMLLSNHTDWSAAQVVQRILSNTVPVAGANSGRINMAAALTTGIEVDHAGNDSDPPDDNYILPHIRLVNHTPENIPLSQFKVRYWYTVYSSDSQIFACDYAPLGGCSNLTGAFTQISSGSPHKTGLSDTYLDVGFTNAAGSLMAGAEAIMYLRIHKSYWSNYNELNDYSYAPGQLDMSAWDRVTVYRNGVLVWGIEPGSTSNATAPAPTATLTKIPPNTKAPPSTKVPTKTATSSSTPVPTATPGHK